MLLQCLSAGVRNQINDCIGANDLSKTYPTFTKRLIPLGKMSGLTVRPFSSAAANCFSRATSSGVSSACMECHLPPIGYPARLRTSKEDATGPSHALSGGTEKIPRLMG